MKKLFAIVLALALVMCLSLPVLAAEGDHSITITETDEGHIFEAYQIFAGDVVVVNGEKVLSNVVWGTGIDAVGTVTWDIGGTPTDLTLLQALANATVNPNYYGLYATAANANDIVAILSTAPNNTTAHAMEFAAIVGEYLIATPTASVNTVTAGVGYVIDGLNDGYYLIKEQEGNDIDPATHTSYILQLVEDVTVNVKAGKVTVDKTILDGNTPTNISDYSIGDEVVFQIEGSLPANYVRFVDYEYIFKDTMSKGLTLNYVDHDSDPATPEVPDLIVQFDNDASLVTVDPSLYTLTVTNEASGETKIDVAFEDLKAIGAMDNYTVTADTKIIVTYTSTLNEDAVVGSTGNPNEVYIEFDNDPYNDGKGETPEDVVYVFTFQLDVTKIDGKEKTTLAGVEFKLYREHGGQKEYVVLDANGKVTGFTTAEADGSVLITDANGKFNVSGLEASVYTLTETKALPGYDSIDDITFTISATYDAVELELVELTLAVDGETQVPGDLTIGVVGMEVVNNPGNTLPATGGLGTKLFFGFGGVLFAGAAILMVTKRRVGEEN